MKIRAAAGDSILAFALILHLYLVPYAKVEESFNLQALHDLLVRGLTNISSFDHLEFPGVVPRTFLGAGAVAVVAWPFHLASLALGQPLATSQTLTRASLGLCAWLAFRHFRRGVDACLGEGVGGCLGLVFALQFHLPFYLTRTLPNTMALVLLLVAYGEWFNCAAATVAATKKKEAPGNIGDAPSSKHNNGGGYTAIALVTAAAVIFRCDVLVFAAPAGLSLLASGHVTFWRGVRVGALSGAGALLLTVLVDSALWRRDGVGWMWPEGEVFFFNAVQNKSHEWGIMPKHWYFSSALPRALLTTSVWAFPSLFLKKLPTNDDDDDDDGEGAAPSSSSPSADRGIAASGGSSSSSSASPSYLTLGLDTATLPWLLPALGSVCLYSLLPHKELRFIFPALPLINVTLAHGLAKLLRSSESLVLSAAPPLTAAAAAAAAAPTSNPPVNGNGSRMCRGALCSLVLWGFVAGPLLSTAAANGVLSWCAVWNYPGGYAFAKAHALFPHPTATATTSTLATTTTSATTLATSTSAAAATHHQRLRVHVDVAAAMTGVSRFGEVHRSLHHHSMGWTYSKDESLLAPSDFAGAFDILVTAKAPSWFLAPGSQAGNENENDDDGASTATKGDVGVCAQPQTGAEGNPPFVLAHSEHGFSRLRLAWWHPFRNRGLAGALGRVERALKLPYVFVETSPQINVLVARGLLGAEQEDALEENSCASSAGPLEPR